MSNHEDELERWFRTAIYHDGDWNPDAMAHIFIKLDELKTPGGIITFRNMLFYHAIVDIAVQFLTRFPNYHDAHELRTTVLEDLFKLHKHIQQGNVPEEYKKRARTRSSICIRLVNKIETKPPRA